MRASRIRNDDIGELLEEVLRKDKLDTEFGIKDGVNYSDDANIDQEKRLLYFPFRGGKDDIRLVILLLYIILAEIAWLCYTIISMII